MKKIIAILLLAFIPVFFAGCGSTKTDDNDKKTSITVAVVETSKVPMDEVVNELKDKYAIELTLFDNNVNAIRAVNDGSADASLAVHKPFMEKFNSENSGDLTMIEPYGYFTGIGLYSEKHNSVESLPDGAKIGIMNDAMNMDRGLRMMEDAGLIKLDPAVSGTYTLLDITENPKNFEFIDMDQIQTVRSLSDLDASIVFFTHMRNADKDFESYLIRDNDAEDYPMGIVVKEENKDAEWAIALAEALQLDSVRKAMTDAFGGVYEFYGQ